MIRKLNIPGIIVPTLYIVNNELDAKLLDTQGIPYLFSLLPDELILLFVFKEWLHENGLYNTALCVIKSKYLEYDIKNMSRELLVTIPYEKGERYSYDKPSGVTESVGLEEFINIKGVKINIEILMNLKLLPKFMCDIEKAIRTNITGFNFTDGYNKKTRLLTGSFTSGYELPNLLIIDISNSTRAVSGVLISLVHTMSYRLNADVIVTGGKSYFYKRGELPSEKEIRSKIPESNEGEMFKRILKNLGHAEYANVIVFGDGDNPGDYEKGSVKINVGHLYAFHTSYNEVPGYGTWAMLKEVAGDKQINEYVTINTTWTEWI